MKHVPVATLNLTKEQLRIAQLFGSMDDRRQQEMMFLLTRIAAIYPCRAKPALLLIVGGAA